MQSQNELYHPAANLFPMMDEEQYSALKADIKENGLIEAIWFCDGKILDGRNRWRACNELNISPDIKEYTGNDPIGFVVSLNLKRRHLNSSQRAIVALEVERLLAVQAKERQVAHLKQGNKSPVVELFPQREEETPAKSRDAAAAIVGINGHYVSDAKRIEATAPELIAEIVAGRMSIPEAKREIKKQEIEEYRQSRRDLPIPATNTATLYAGDCFDNINLIKDGAVNLAIIDPPYNVTDYEWDKIGTPVEFMQFTKSWLDAIAPKLADSYHLFVFCDSAYMADIEMLLRAEGWPIKSRVVWQYRNLVRGRDVKDKFIQNWQMIFHIGNHPLNWPVDWNDSRFAVQTYAAPQSNFEDGKFHPHQKPQGLIDHFVNIGSLPGDTVLDVFAGSGTTGIAAVNNGREAILMEQSPEYVEIIKQRLNGRCIDGRD